MILRALYQDDADRARALHAIAEGCTMQGGRLLILAPEVECERIRAALRAEDTPCTCVAFRPLPDALEPGPSGWPALSRAAIAALSEIPTVERPLVAWLDPSAAPEALSTERGALDYRERVEQPIDSVASLLISSCRAGALPRAAPLAFAAGADGFMSASYLSAPVLAPLGRPLRDSIRPPSPRAEDCNCCVQLEQTKHLTAIGLMAAGVAHELANPLSIISSSLQYLHQRLAKHNDPSSDFAMAALQNVERMHGMLRNLLNFAAVRGPELKLADLNQVIAEAAGLLSAECERLGIRMEIALADDLPTFRLDASRIKQIMLNLLRNALDAMLTHGTHLWVRTRYAREDGMAVIEVENDGPQISPEALDGLFRAFFTTKGGGTGLGLYLSRQNAKEHGGNIVAENIDNKVRFTVTIAMSL